MAKTTSDTIVIDGEHEARKGIDGVYRVWKKLTFLDLGWMTSEEVYDQNMYNPIQWVIVGAFNSIDDAKAVVTQL